MPSTKKKLCTRTLCLGKLCTYALWVFYMIRLILTFDQLPKNLLKDLAPFLCPTYLIKQLPFTVPMTAMYLSAVLVFCVLFWSTLIVSLSQYHFRNYFCQTEFLVVGMNSLLLCKQWKLSVAGTNRWIIERLPEELTSKEGRDKGDNHMMKMVPKLGYNYKEDILPLSFHMQHHCLYLPFHLSFYSGNTYMKVYQKLLCARKHSTCLCFFVTAMSQRPCAFDWESLRPLPKLTVSLRKQPFQFCLSDP